MKHLTRKTVMHLFHGKIPHPKSVAADMVNQVLDSLIEAIVNGNLPVQISGLGVFEVKERRGRSVRNPVTGEQMTIPKRRVVNFRASSSLLRTLAHQVPSSVPRAPNGPFGSSPARARSFK